MLRLGDHERRPGADDLASLPQDHLELTRITFGARELGGANRRLDVREAHRATLDLRDGLLCDDHYIPGFEPTGTSRRVGQQAAEVSVCGQLRDTRERDDSDAGAHSTPVTRIPACAL